jgi:putative heme-binding domain-containing protein
MRFAFAGAAGLAFLLSIALPPGRPDAPADPYAAHVSRADPRSPEEERKGFHLPPGFDVELVAAEPYVHKPININFDDRGRLWVTESVEYPFPARPGARHRDSVRILEDTNGDGLVDEVTTFTGGLNIPIGVLPLRRGALIYSIPGIYRFDDADGDDRADGQRLLYTGFGHKDTHGMTGEFTWGFDGWVYACHGFANTSTIRGADGHAITMTSGNTYRFRPDGSRVEHFTHGQVNPFGLCFDPLGNLYSCDCHSRPIYQLLRGAYYPSFGRPHDGLGYGPELMNHDHGSTAIAGITYYAADHFPPEYRGTVFVGNVVTNRINHDRFEWHGSSPLAIQQPDFLTSDDPWFRPVDIKLGPDGALYVADFYNRIIGHYEVPLTHPGRDHYRGRIWRIIYRGPDGKGYPHKPRADWNKASVAELVHDLAHPNLVVRMKATNQLVERGGADAARAVQALMKPASAATQRAHGLWVLERLSALDESTLAAGARDPETIVRVHALRVLAERGTLSPRLREVVLASLQDADPLVRRTAADALGRHPSPENVRPLLDLRQAIASDDTHLLHIVRMALRDQLRRTDAWPHLAQTIRGEADARALADVVPGVHLPESAGFLLQHLKHYPEPRENQVRYVYHIARYGTESATADLLDWVRGDRGAGLRRQLDVFKAIQDGTQARGRNLSAAARTWGETLTRQLLASNQDDDVLAGIELGAALRTANLPAFLVDVVADRSLSEARRESALAALAALDARKYTPFLGRILDAPGEVIPIRQRAARLLADTRHAEAVAELVHCLPTAPQRLARTIAAGLAGSKSGAEQLLAAVAAGKASAHLLMERRVEEQLEQAGLPSWKERVAALTRGLPTPDQRLHELMERRRAGFLAARKDPSLGARVFEKNCAICHQLANHGAKIGPQLDGVGIRGLDRLMEDILDPSRNVDQAFRTTTLGLTNGQVVSGLLLREEGEVLVLADNQGKEVRVPKASVDDRTLSQLSPMPANLADQIPESDFYHLLAYLLTQQPTKPAATNGTRTLGR